MASSFRAVDHLSASCVLSLTSFQVAVSGFFLHPVPSNVLRKRGARQLNCTVSWENMHSMMYCAFWSRSSYRCGNIAADGIHSHTSNATICQRSNSSYKSYNGHFKQSVGDPSISTRRASGSRAICQVRSRAWGSARSSTHICSKPARKPLVFEPVPKIFCLVEHVRGEKPNTDVHDDFQEPPVFDAM